MFDRMVVILGVKRRLDQVVDVADDPDELANIVRSQRKWNQPEPPRGIARAWDIETVDINGFDLHLGVNPSAPRRRVILYLHGGGYIFGPFRPEWTMLTKLASAADCDFALLDYPKAPEHHAGETQAVVQKALTILTHRYGAPNLVLAGLSAGGGLAITAMIALRDAGLPMPARAVLMSPAVDMTMSDEASHLADNDLILSIDFIRAAGEIYSQPLEPANAQVSPLYADLRDLAPLLVLVGDREILLPSIERFAAAAINAGTDVEFVAAAGQQHGWPQAPTPEGGEAINRMATFVSTSPS
jgi:acetyl esterase/lipase